MITPPKRACKASAFIGLSVSMTATSGEQAKILQVKPRFSKTCKSSANDNVYTLPKIKAYCMDKLKIFIKTHQQALVLVTGYALVTVLAFGLGRLTTGQHSVPQIRVEEAFSAPSNYSPTVAAVQSVICKNKIKGSSSMIYHVPGGSFYNRTTSPIRCFDTEADAKAAGFRRSSR